jgi:TonB family protein
MRLRAVMAGVLMVAGTAGAQAKADGAKGAMKPDSGKPYFEYMVARPATQAADTKRPEYPAAMRGSGVGGDVLVQFVVDTTGLPVAGSLKVLKASRPEFAEAVKAAFPGMKFSPAQVADGRKVRQLVQMPFVFKDSGK